MTDERLRSAEAEVLPIGARAPRDAATTVARVVAVADAASDLAGAAQMVIEAMAGGLGLTRARLFLGADCEAAGPVGTRDAGCLDLVASAGSHASITRDMPSVRLDSDTDVGRVAVSGEPEFHGDVHGLGAAPTGERTGLGRWREGVTTQSSAVLPLTVRGRLLGVVSLEWAAPREFGVDERASLTAVVSAASLVTDSFLAQDVRSVPDVAPAGCTPGPAAELEVTRDGMVVPAGAPGGWNTAPALRLHVAAAAPALADTEEAFWDVVGVRSGLVVLTLGVASSPRAGAAETAETARHMLRASALQGARPARGLGLLAGWLSAAGKGTSWVSAVTCEIDVRRTTMTWCAAGSLALTMRYPDGRSDVLAAPHPPLGSTAAPELADRDALLLPGDLVALCAGDIAALTSAEGRAAAADALAALSEGGPARVLGRFMEVLRTPLCAEGALIVEVAE